MDLNSRWSNLGVNTALIIFGIGAIVLLYALATRQLTPRTSPERTTETGLVGQIIQVEVRNACGVTGLAKTTTDFLRRKGFDVVEVGDHDEFNVERSVVIDRIGDLDAARKLATTLGLPADRVEQDIREDFYLDASVIIGKDYEIMRPFN